MITKKQIIEFLEEAGKKWKYTEEGYIVTEEILFFINNDLLFDIAENNLSCYQNWES